MFKIFTKVFVVSIFISIANYGQKVPEKSSVCLLEYSKVAEDLSGSQRKRLFNVKGMDFRNPNCDIELEKFGKKEVNSIGGNAVIVSFTNTGISSFNFKNFKDANVSKIFTRYKKLPIGSNFDKDPFATGKYYK